MCCKSSGNISWLETRESGERHTGRGAGWAGTQRGWGASAASGRPVARLLGELARFVLLPKDLVYEDGKVEREAESNRVGGGK